MWDVWGVLFGINFEDFALISHFNNKLQFVVFLKKLPNSKKKHNKNQTDVIKKRNMTYENYLKNSIYAVFLLT